MRSELRGLAESDYWLYGLSEEDFGYTLDLALRFVAARRRAYETYAAAVRLEQPESADDILDDVAHYTWVDMQYLWHFSLWRLQAILEGLIVHTFLKNASSGRLLGLKAKLDAMMNAGFRLESRDYEDLLAWAQLRNAFSHAPPEQYRPGPLTEADVREYLELANRVCTTWRQQQSLP
jgi:hypothetical protein